MRPLTRSCFLLLVLGRLLLLALPVLLGICLPSRCSPLFPLHAPALIPLSCLGAVLAHLDSLPPHDLVLRSDGFVPFPLAKGGSGVLAICSLSGTEATLSFSAGPVCSSFSAEACTILHALCWSRQHQQVCHFSSSILLSFCPLLCFSFYLKLCGRSGRNCHLSSILSGYNGSPDTRLSENDAADELASWRGLFTPSAIPCSLSPLISRIHSCFFLDWRRTVSLKFFDTQVPSISTEELVLPHHACCVLSHLRCNGHSLLLSSYLSRIGRIENPSCSACGHFIPEHLSSHSALSSYKLFALFTFWRLSVSLRPLAQTLGSCLASGGSMIFRHAPFPRKGSGKQQQIFSLMEDHLEACIQLYPNLFPILES